MALKDLFTHSLTRKTAIGTADGFGGHTTVWAEDSTFKGRLRNLSGSEFIYEGQRTLTETTHIIYCGLDVECEAKDRVESNGEEYEVTAPIRVIYGATAPDHQVIELKLLG